MSRPAANGKMAVPIKVRDGVWAVRIPEPGRGDVLRANVAGGEEVATALATAINSCIMATEDAWIKYVDAVEASHRETIASLIEDHEAVVKEADQVIAELQEQRATVQPYPVPVQDRIADEREALTKRLHEIAADIRMRFTGELNVTMMEFAQMSAAAACESERITSSHVALCEANDRAIEHNRQGTDSDDD